MSSSKYKIPAECKFYKQNQCKYTDNECKFLHESLQEYQTKKYEEYQKNTATSFRRNENKQQEQYISEEMKKMDDRLITDCCLCIEYDIALDFDDESWACSCSGSHRFSGHPSLKQYIWFSKKEFPDGISEESLDIFKQNINNNRYDYVGPEGTIYGGSVTVNIIIKNMVVVSMSEKRPRPKQINNKLYYETSLGSLIIINDKFKRPGFGHY